MQPKSLFRSNYTILVALFLGVLTGYWNQPMLNTAANAVSDTFINLLKLISAPIIFLSIVSTVSGMKNAEDFKLIGKKLIKYTLLTTYAASVIALVLFLVIDPANSHSLTLSEMNESLKMQDKNYLHYLLQIVPSNLLEPFIQNQVISVLFLAILFSLTILSLSVQHRTTLHTLFSALQALFLKIAATVVYFIPIAIWAFITLFIKELQAGLQIQHIALYLLTILLANLIQGFIILPVFAKSRGVSPKRLAKAMLPALSMAFFSKSSSATLPLAMQCAENKAGIPKKLSGLAFPLCTAINMNGCAAFILITVLFVAMSHGLPFSGIELALWTFIATIAAVGNAGVPMGCFFLSTAFLASMNVPLNLMALILPFYAILDMIETTVNVWSDACVVAAVNQETEMGEIDSLATEITVATSAPNIQDKV